MGRAIAAGLLRGGMHATDILIAEPRPEQCELLRRELYGVSLSDDKVSRGRLLSTLYFPENAHKCYLKISYRRQNKNSLTDQQSGTCHET